MRKPILFVVSLIGLAVSVGVVILMLPSRFDPNEDGNLLVNGVPVLVAVLCAIGVYRWRPRFANRSRGENGQLFDPNHQ